MEEDGTLFARASLDGEIWRDALVHGEECAWCRELRDPPATEGGGAGRPAGPGTEVDRGWMVAVSAVTVIAALLAALLN
ncbi:hypothetical protein ACFWUW_13945 [Streptomyces sp. NPDC058655]|uniref:hypothetical protein n=1 Tax=unclassified Streptomyces TaxID=2593676 RepID=UPI00364D5C4D